MNTNGRILWEGPSAIDGEPIVLIATGFDTVSSNDKTGNMIQTWILCQNVKPNEGYKDGRNYSICGNCPHAGYNQGSCYVKWFHAPLSVWNCYKRGNYPHIGNDWHLFDNQALRLGSAGDPAMIPVNIWHKMLENVKTNTGYTHQWREDFAKPFKGIVQASCDSETDYIAAKLENWFTFNVKPSIVDDYEGTIHCQASIEKGQKTNCATCGLCSGNQADIIINAHGNNANKVPVAA